MAKKKVSTEKIKKDDKAKKGKEEKGNSQAVVSKDEATESEEEKEINRLINKFVLCSDLGEQHDIETDIEAVFIIINNKKIVLSNNTLKRISDLLSFDKKDKQPTIKDLKKEGWVDEEVSIRFWSFKNVPVFTGRYKMDMVIESRQEGEDDSEVYLFIEEETGLPFYINRFSAVTKALEKVKNLPDGNGELKEMMIKECQFIVLRLQFLGKRDIQGGKKKFNEFNVLSMVD